MTRFRLLLLSFAWLVLPAVALGEDAKPADPVADAAGHEFFEKQIRPILAARCFECHGAEADEPGGSLRLDVRQGAFDGGDSGPAVVPGNLQESLLIDAVDTNELYEMPPKSRLPDEEIALLRKWVEMGAPWPESGDEETVITKATFDLAGRSEHWCYQPIRDVKPPAVKNAEWLQSPIDAFVMAGLEAANLEPAPPADKRALLRRVTFDLTGLPPSPEEIEAFLADESPDAYRKVVDRLLASPHYGERWARHWLDLVRYAETYGHEFDFEIPNAYRYRDYLIRALNDDVPYDALVLEHLAGDLLPNPRRHPTEKYNESVLGTGFFFFGEAKHSPVDVRLDEADRIDNQIDVISKTFLAQTISCARCHDHKFDAIPTTDYYALAGVLQSSRYHQAFIDDPAERAPYLAELARLQSERQAALRSAASTKLAAWADASAEYLMSHRAAAGAGLPDQAAWQEKLNAARQRLDHPLHVWAVLGDPAFSQEEFNRTRAGLAERLRAAQAEADKATIDWDFSQGLPEGWKALGEAFGDRPIQAGELPPAGSGSQIAAQPASHSGALSPSLQGVLQSPTFTIESPDLFYRVYGTSGEVRLILDGLQLIQDPIYGGLKFGPDNEQPYWRHQNLSKWVGHRAYIEVVDEGDGYVALERVTNHQPHATEHPFDAAMLAMLEDDSLVSTEQLAARYQQLFQQAAGAWQNGKGKANSTLAWLIGAESPVGSLTELAATPLAEFDRQRAEVDPKLPPQRRALSITDGTPENEHVFIRGSHKNLGEEVPRRFMAVIDPSPVTQGSGRLELAQRMIDPENPLVTRVFVNRLWKHHFGDGIVRTPDDFGRMGQAPTNPDLLDFLARELVRQSWSIKNMHRLMVLSSTYQMGSSGTPAADEADPENKLMHRMPIRRLEAEAIRDAMLAVSGRLDPTMYGPSVAPHLTPFMLGRGRPGHSGPVDGAGRRSLYLGIRRNFLMPMFLAFDYPQPFTTIGRRSVSNVPAQALTMMNNPLTSELAQVWATRLVQSPAEPAKRIESMYATALGRPPEENELAAALTFVVEQSRQYGDMNDTRVWADFAHVLFNLKEFIFLN